MPRAGSWALELEARGRPWIAHVLTEVARVVSRSPPGDGILLEVTCAPLRAVVLSPVPGLLASIYRRVRELGGGLRAIPTPLPGHPPAGPALMEGELRPRAVLSQDEPDRGASSQRSLAAPRSAPEGSPLDPLPSVPHGWWMAQLHWVSADAPRLYVNARYRCAAGSRTRRLRTDLWDRFLSESLAAAEAPPGQARWHHQTRHADRVWSDGRLRRTPLRNAFLLSPSAAARFVVASLGRDAPPMSDGHGHTVVFGSSGSGKTTYLVNAGARWIAGGRPVFAVDVHGDLGPRLLHAASGQDAGRWVAVDASRPPAEVGGISVLGSGPRSSREREAAMVVAAIRRLSSDGDTVYWGFRLERIFDTFVRLVQESGGGLRDLYALLTDPRRRESVRAQTRSFVRAQFLDELPSLLQRNPEFLWPAAARLSKVALVPALGALLSPESNALDLPSILAAGQSLVVRVPMSVLGPEAASFAASLVVGSVYLACLGSVPRDAAHPHWLFLLDEAHALAPRLLTEILAEGRKFGVQAVLATQYLDRLTPEVRWATQGTVNRHVFFRVPAAAARDAALSVGLTVVEGARLLSTLPTGAAVVYSPVGVELLRVPVPAASPDSGQVVWERAVDATLGRLGGDEARVESADDGSLATVEDRVLLAAFGAVSAGKPANLEELVRRLGEDSDPRVELDRASAVVDLLVHRGLLERDKSGFLPTLAGLAMLGVTSATGAVKEGGEHRALLLAAFRIFARRGLRLTILRQGRFDRRIPDAVFRLLPEGLAGEEPRLIGEALDRARGSWAWRFFGGRNVHVEAEVSGARRPERIRRGLAKARDAGAFALFVVGDATKARYVRRVLLETGRHPRDTQVWTLHLPK